jgi:hypothetical protein
MEEDKNKIRNDCKFSWKTKSNLPVQASSQAYGEAAEANFSKASFMGDEVPPQMTQKEVEGSWLVVGRV